MDIRDDRADDTTGWVFGTFVYNDDHEGDTPFEKMRPGTVSTDYSLQLAFGIINFKQSKSINFAAIANSMAQAWASKDIATSREFTKKLDTQKEVLDRPMMLDGQLYFPISPGD